MSKLKDTKSRLQSKLEVIKKINDDPNSLSDSLSDKFLKDLPSTEQLFGKKLDDFLNKSKRKKENKKDIFGELIEIAEGFLSSGKKVETSDKLFSKGKLKQHALTSSRLTLDSSKEIVVDSVKKAFFAGDGICGTNLTLNETNVTIKPEEIDLMNILTIDPTTSTGQIVYEPKSPNKGKEKVNRELYNLFSGGTYQFDSNSNNTLFSGQWSQSNQEFNITDFNGLEIETFFNDYYSTIELPDTEHVAKTAMLMTIQGDGSDNPLFNKGMNDINRLLQKLSAVCGNPTKTDELKNQNAVDMFNETDEDIESYFNFDDVEGIDLDSEDSRFRRVLKFRDCDNFETPVNISTIEDFVFFSNKKPLNELVDLTLNRTATQSYLDSGSNIPQLNFNLNLMNLFILNLPKALISSLLTPKIFLPIVIVYKVVKSNLGESINVKTLMKTLSKLFKTIISGLLWKFIQEFWKLVKIDLMTYVMKIVKKILKNKTKRYVTILKSLIAFLINVLQSEINNCYSLFTAITNAITTALSANISLQVPGILLLLSKRLPGYSQDRAFMNIMERLDASGVKTGPIFGEPNNIGTLVKSIIDGHTEEEDQNSFIKISLEGGALPPTPAGVGATIIPGIISGYGKKF
jgi:hypothetical protein